MKQTILAISGKPGLYKLVSRAKNSLIVEALDETHKRIPAFGSDRITSLADIAMFTETDDVPLMKVLASMRDLEQGKPSSVNFKKATRRAPRVLLKGTARMGSGPCAELTYQEAHPVVRHPHQGRHHRLRRGDGSHRGRQHRRPQGLTHQQDVATTS